MLIGISCNFLKDKTEKLFRQLEYYFIVAKLFITLADNSSTFFIFLVHIRDPVNPNFVVPIKGFKVKVKSLGIQSPPSQLVNKILSEVVAKSVLNVDLKTNQSLETLQKGKPN